MNEPYRSVRSAIIPLLADNVDTDQIIPARYLTTTTRTGLAEGLFRDWRVLPDGQPNPDFILNRPEMAGRQILLVGDNFGSGSSREHAPWALVSWGIRAVVALSFADIFRANALKNSLLPIVVDAPTHARLVQLLSEQPDTEATISLETQQLGLADGTTISFEVDPFARQMLLAGTDEIGWLLERSNAIDRYEQTHPARIDTRPESAAL